MKNIKLRYMSVILIASVSFSSCKKDWLDGKPNKSLVIPTTVADYQALLDNTDEINQNQPSLSMVGDGDYYVTDTRYNSLSQTERSAYIWAPTSSNFYSAATVDDWTDPYQRILIENVVLDGVQKLQNVPGSQVTFNNVMGSALFYRSFDFYNVAQIFCKQYLSSSASSDLGLPLRTSSNINITLNRSSVQQTYDQIINDLLKAVPLLPVTPLFPTRPSKPAVFGLLARVYLSQANYPKALLYADSCLQLENTLIDFNQLTPTASHPVPHFNKEVIFSTTLITYLSYLSSRLIVDSTLYKSYNLNDLRRSVYFGSSAGNITFKGSYDGSSVFFGGFATDEMYLIRAECNARAGNTTAALNDLNALLKNRWVTGSYVNMTAISADAALSLILTERRKELCFRALRWTDLRRLNLETRFQTTLTRTVNGQNYTLSPNSSRYVLPLDNNELQIGGLQQNPR
jgi:hypothetical protein